MSMVVATTPSPSDMAPQYTRNRQGGHWARFTSGYVQRASSSCIACAMSHSREQERAIAAIFPYCAVRLEALLDAREEAEDVIVVAVPRRPSLVFFGGRVSLWDDSVWRGWDWRD